MTYRDALARLSEARRFGMKLGLEPMRELAQELGQPQEKLRFIHIAGTNGKGSTAAFLESCLRAGGQRVGLYTSPHLITVCERIQVDRRPTSEGDFAAGMDRICAAALKRGLEPTFFELLTALALDYFARVGVDWVVWETGLGGRLDATNIVTPRAVIITNIGLDHMAYLGSTLKEIAREKAGIIKSGIPVITAAGGEALEVITHTAHSLQAPLCRIPTDFPAVDHGRVDGVQRAQLDGNEFSLGLMGSHQVANAACAVATLRRVAPDLTPAALAQGLRSASWPGRFEILSSAPLIVVDGAHNPAAMRTLAQTWRVFLGDRFPDQIPPTHLVFGTVSDKDSSGMIRELLPLIGEVDLVPLDHERSSDPQKLIEAFAALSCRLNASVAQVADRLRAVPPRAPVLITGSLFLVAEFLAVWRGLAGEYHLNETLERRSGP